MRRDKTLESRVESWVAKKSTLMFHFFSFSPVAVGAAADWMTIIINDLAPMTVETAAAPAAEGGAARNLGRNKSLSQSEQ